MSGPRIVTARAGDRSGFVIAVMPPEGQEHVAPSAQTRSGATLITGSLYRTSRDDQPEKWRAWLWPEAGGVMNVTRSCEAVDAPALERLREKLQKRADKDGPWWGGEAP